MLPDSKIHHNILGSEIHGFVWLLRSNTEQSTSVYFIYQMYKRIYDSIKKRNK